MSALIVYCRVDPGRSSSRLQVTVPAVIAHGMLVVGFVTSAGSVVTIWVDVDGLGPSLDTAIVQVGLSPAATGSGASVIVTARSVVLNAASMRAASSSLGKVAGSTGTEPPGFGKRWGR